MCLFVFCFLLRLPFVFCGCFLRAASCLYRPLCLCFCVCCCAVAVVLFIHLLVDGCPFCLFVCRLVCVFVFVFDFALCAMSLVCSFCFLFCILLCFCLGGFACVCCAAAADAVYLFMFLDDGCPFSLSACVLFSFGVALCFLCLFSSLCLFYYSVVVFAVALLLLLMCWFKCFPDDVCPFLFVCMFALCLCVCVLVVF